MPDAAEETSPGAPNSMESGGEDERDAVVETVAFLPKWFSLTMIVGWITLFSGRWLIIQGMEAAGLLAPEQVEHLDASLLTPCYVLLLSITLVVLVLRFVPRPKVPAASPVPENVVSEVVVEKTMQSDVSSRRGKQA